jgi:predicted Fe-Mo cluster-binding NifX family protein
MKIAIPVFETRISPRFDFAPGFGLYDIDGENITGRTEISCQGWSDIERVSKLKTLGVDTLICGGLPGYLLCLLTNNGITVIPWIAGNARDALKLFLQGRLDAGMVICSKKKKRNRCKRSRE